MVTVPLGSGDVTMKYLLFADNSVFDNWTDWVNDSVNSPTQKNLDNAATFSNYVLKINCALTNMYNACGLKSASHGAIMIMSPNTEG